MPARPQKCYRAPFDSYLPAYVPGGSLLPAHRRDQSLPPGEVVTRKGVSAGFNVDLNGNVHFTRIHSSEIDICHQWRQTALFLLRTAAFCGISAAIVLASALRRVRNQ